MSASTAITAEQGQNVPDYQAQLSAHSSRLPNSLYILSFAPSYPSPIRQFTVFIQHPHVLYAIGTTAAFAAGVGLPAFDMIFGWWSNGIRGIDASPESILHAGSNAGWVTTVVGVVFTCLFAIFVICCE
jgi:ATP-binding cassette subfamily B (MDR/TAP) protein 1